MILAWDNIICNNSMRARWEDNYDGSSGSGMWGMDWIKQAQDRDRWQALVNAVMILRVP
jgi:hypothetical protein